jgi:hypothetical protein
MPNLADQIREALSMFARTGTKPALIGGLAVAAHQVVRATKDVDFLVAAEAADRVHDALLALGYQCLYRSADAANYVRGTEGLDLLFAHRPLALRLLAGASERETPLGRLRVISDTDRAELDSGVVLAREAGLPFQPPPGSESGMDPIAEWLSLMEVVQMLCPAWPVRDRPMQGNSWKL